MTRNANTRRSGSDCAKLEKNLGSIADLTRLPSALFVIDVLKENIAVREANRLGWKEADGDQLLLRPGEETIWYYAHEQDKVKRLCNDMTCLLYTSRAGLFVTLKRHWRPAPTTRTPCS